MSNQPMQWDLDASGLRFAIVAARFNPTITDRLVEGAREALESTKAEHFEVFRVPGAFELPLAAKSLAESGDSDAVIALGAVIRGGTPHFDYIAGEAARGLLDVALSTNIPVAFGVLTTEDDEQAESRAGGKDGNKGFDAAMTAVEMARFVGRG